MLAGMALLAVFFVTALIGRASAAAELKADESVRARLQAAAMQDPSGAAEAVLKAESSRQKRIRDSVEASLYLIASAYESSVAESLSVEASVEAHLASVAEASSRYASVVASVSESVRQSSIYERLFVHNSIHESRESSIAESVAESIAESIAESSRAEAVRQASIAEASRKAAEASRAEAARQAAAAASRAAAAAAASAAATPATGKTFLFGDSRASGFSVWHFWPESQVYWMYSQIDVNYDKGRAAAARYPAKIVFLNGVDDIIAHGNAQAAKLYEAFIADFQSRSPSTKIYVGNVLPVGPAGTARYPQLGNIAGYNTLLQAMCARRGWTYIDASQGFSMSDLMPDGIHFSSVWTQKWLNNLRARAGF